MGLYADSLDNFVDASHLALLEVARTRLKYLLWQMWIWLWLRTILFLCALVATLHDLFLGILVEIASSGSG